MTLLLCLFHIFVLAHGLLPSSRSAIVREQALTYLSFDTAFSNSSGQVLASGNSTHILVRKGAPNLFKPVLGKDSDAYLWLTRNNTDPELKVYQAKTLV